MLQILRFEIYLCFRIDFGHTYKARVARHIFQHLSGVEHL